MNKLYRVKLKNAKRQYFVVAKDTRSAMLGAYSRYLRDVGLNARANGDEIIADIINLDDYKETEVLN